MDYTPFEKDLLELDEQELQKLISNEISEGWYIEYKTDFSWKSSKIEGDKIAKPISAFANTKGGWLFYGIQSNDKNIATNLCGIDLNKHNNLPDQISQIISSNITPRPIYHVKTVPLLNGNYVFVIKIEESPIPPYITSQGIIFQRENNESVPIKDRYILEKLTEKANEYFESIERFCKMDYGETKGQANDNHSYLELYLFPLPYNEFKFKNFFNTDFFKKVAVRFYQNVESVFERKDGTKTELNLNLGFNSIYSSQDSLIIRPLNDDNLIYKTTTAELFRNGGLKFLIPLGEFNINHVPKYYEGSEVINYLKDKYSPYETKIFNDYYGHLGNKGANYRERKDTNFVRHINMIDGAELIYCLLIVITKYRAILEDNEFDINSEIGFRARITDTWRKFVFFDNIDYLEKLKLYNLPLAPKKDLEVPSFIKGNYYEIDISEQYSFFHIARMILDAIGLPDSSTIQFADIINDSLKRYDFEKNK